MKHARVINGKVVEIIHSVEGLSLPDRFQPEFVASLVECPDQVEAGWLFDGTGFAPAPPLPARPLAEVKADVSRLIDTLAETERLKYITPGYGQAMTYQQKVSEAQAFKTAVEPQGSDFPILSSEVGITGQTLDEVADVVLAAFSQWQVIGAAIEGIRLGAKRDIEAAVDEAAAHAVVDAIVWPSEQAQP